MQDELADFFSTYRYLVETAGASIDSRSDSGRTPLQVAAAMGRLVYILQFAFPAY